MSHRILLLPGDGIGPEVVEQARRVLVATARVFDLDLIFDSADLGGVAIDRHGDPYPESTRLLARQADAILLGAVGGPKWDTLPAAQRPERGLLAIRSDLDLFCNLRPAMLYPQLADASSLKPDLVAGLNLLIVRELTGGIYFGEPRGVETSADGVRRGFNTDVYDETEIGRIARLAFQFAQKRNGRLCSVDKANVLEVTMLWRDIVTEVSAEFPEIELSHMYVDNAAMQLVREPKQFDVVLTGNLFGDILSDTAAMLTGSIGMLPSASLNAESRGLYEPVHGSAPDIAGKGVVNPIAMILSLAMMFEYTFDRQDLARIIKKSVDDVLESGYFTKDLSQNDYITTNEMGDKILESIKKLC